MNFKEKYSNVINQICIHQISDIFGMIKFIDLLDDFFLKKLTFLKSQVGRSILKVLFRVKLISSILLFIIN